MARILIIDDNVLIRTLLREILGDGGHEVVGQAPNGVEAPGSIFELRPDVVTLDLVMPGRTGFTTLHHLLMLDSSLAVIVCSAALSQDRMAEARRLGAKGFIAKPFTRQAVLATVRDVLEHAERKGEAVTPTQTSSPPDSADERREFVRVRARLPVFVVTAGGAPLDSYTVDISAGGVLLERAMLEPNTSVRFSLGLGAGKQPIDGRGRVVRVTDDGNLAFAFEHVSVDGYERLVRYIEACHAVRPAA